MPIPRKKSCQQCRVAKARCSLDPVCSRCLERGMPCNYAGTAFRSSPYPAVPAAQPVYRQTPPFDTFAPLDLGDIVDLDLPVSDSPVLTDDFSINRSNGRPDDNVSCWDTGIDEWTRANPPPSAPTMERRKSPEWSSDVTRPAWLGKPGMNEKLSGIYFKHTSVEDTLGANLTLRHNYMDPRRHRELQTQTADEEVAPIGWSRTLQEQSSRSLVPTNPPWTPTEYGAPGSCSGPVSSHSSMALYGRRFATLLERRQTTNVETRLTTQVILGQITAYPRMLVTPGGKLPPFIHPRCVLDDRLSRDCCARDLGGNGVHSCLPAPLANCASLVGMYYSCATVGGVSSSSSSSSSTSNQGFVWGLIYGEVRRLRRELVAGNLGRDDPDEVLAAMQACGVYILLQAEDRGTLGVNDVGFLIETTSEIALKMHFSCDYLSDIYTLPRLTRRLWVHNESMRRTACLMFIVELLFEVFLGDPDRLECKGIGGSPLPCGRAMWDPDASEAWSVRLQRHLSGRAPGQKPIVVVVSDLREVCGPPPFGGVEGGRGFTGSRGRRTGGAGGDIEEAEEEKEEERRGGDIDGNVNDCGNKGDGNNMRWVVGERFTPREGRGLIDHDKNNNNRRNNNNDNRRRGDDNDDDEGERLVRVAMEEEKAHERRRRKALLHQVGRWCEDLDEFGTMIWMATTLDPHRRRM